MAKVAVIGSRITRDLWPRDGGEFDVLHIARSSLPSLLSRPPPDLRLLERPAVAVDRDTHEAVIADLRKTALRDLVAFRPSHIVMDLYDERFDLLLAGGCVVTDSPELEASGYHAQPALAGARRVPRFSPACDRLWAEAAREFAEFIGATPLTSATLVLHVSRWPERRPSQGDGTVPFKDLTATGALEADTTTTLNALFEAYESQLVSLFPGMQLVNPPPDVRLSDDAGDTSLRFIPEYDDQVRSQLRELGIPTSGTVAPSAPEV